MTLFSVIPEHEPIDQCPVFPHFFLTRTPLTFIRTFRQPHAHAFAHAHTHIHTHAHVNSITRTPAHNDLCLYPLTRTHTSTHPVIKCYISSCTIIYCLYLINSYLNCIRPFHELFSFPTPPLLFQWKLRSRSLDTELLSMKDCTFSPQMGQGKHSYSVCFFQNKDLIKWILWFKYYKVIGSPSHI